jgi:hypothetical protein
VQKINRLFAAAGIGALALMANSASAAVVLSSTVDQSGFSGLQNAASYPLTGTPFNFTGQGAGNLVTITGLTITLTVSDGDTSPADYDFGNLTLVLDGHNTGLALNGFLNNQIMGLDLSGNPALAALILADLKADNKLVGTVADATPGNSPQGDIIGFPFAIQTTLELTGDVRTNGGGGNPVPVPAAVLLAPLGAGVAGAVSRRFRKAK